MSEIIAQASFTGGEWSPTMFARVDLQKYRTGAALMNNWFVDVRGGASTRPGTQYITYTWDQAYPVRLISFQAVANAGYVLEFGNAYLRFIYQESLVLESALAITAISLTSGVVITVPGHSYSASDSIYLTGILGSTQLNNQYWAVLSVSGNNITLGATPTVASTALANTGISPYISGGTCARVYKISSPYAAADLALVKFAQITNQMVLCHPNYPPYILTILSANSWTLTQITFGSTAATPSIGFVNSTLGAGLVNYSYGVTSIDGNGQESNMSAPVALTNTLDISLVAGTNFININPVAGAVAYNYYKAVPSYDVQVQPGVNYGFIGTTTGTTFADTNITTDFSIAPPINQNPFNGLGIAYFTVTAAGTYTTVPTVTLTGGTPGTAASVEAKLGAQPTPTITAGGSGYHVGDNVNFGDNVVLQVTTVSSGAITGWTIVSAGGIFSGSTPSNPVAQVTTSGTGTGATATITWGVVGIKILSAGAGYLSTPTVSFSSGSAAATAYLGPENIGNPAVPAFFQQRLLLAGSTAAPQSFNMSQPGSYFNFNTSSIVNAGDAISGTLVSTVPTAIKSVVSTTTGAIMLTDKAVYILNGGAAGAAVSPISIAANVQSYIGANDVPPIVANYDILFVQNKGSAIRDLAYNIYFNIFTGTDITVTSNHLFFGHEILEWTWAEAPFYQVMAVRDDGIILNLTFMKEQEFVAWSHTTCNGTDTYQSICSVTELLGASNNTDAVYVTALRPSLGGARFIERFTSRVYLTTSDPWCVDCGVRYTGSANTTFTGAIHLAGSLVSGTADGVAITPFIMPATGTFTLPTAASNVTIGIGYTCDLRTLPIDTGQIQIQGKLKKIPCVDVRVNQTLGLSIGVDENHLTPMKDLVVGNVSSMLTGQQSQIVSGLYTGDARTFLGPTYTIPGQYHIQQAQPYPATVLGVFPTLVFEDTP